MAARGDSRQQIEAYLEDCRSCFLLSAQQSQRFSHTEVVDDLARAIRYAGANGELLGVLVVLGTLSHQEGSTDFRCFSLSAQQRLRAEIRDHLALGVCDSADIKMGAELALSSLRPLAAA
jgi:hypothetical protein